jgi:hypothetical protein
MAHLNTKIDQVHALPIQIDSKVNTLWKQVEAQEAEAKNYLQKSQQSKGTAKEMYKQKAVMALKKKKQIQQQIQKLNSQQNMLQQAAFNVETVQGHKELVIFA